MEWSESYNVSLQKEYNENKQSHTIIKSFARVNSLCHIPPWVSFDTLNTNADLIL